MTPAQKTARIIQLGKTIKAWEGAAENNAYAIIHQITYTDTRTGKRFSTEPLCGVGKGCVNCTAINDSVIEANAVLIARLIDGARAELAGLMDGEADQANEGQVGDS